MIRFGDDVASEIVHIDERQVKRQMCAQRSDRARLGSA
jgi:hypothetical protein